MAAALAKYVVIIEPDPWRRMGLTYFLEALDVTVTQTNRTDSLERHLKAGPDIFLVSDTLLGTDPEKLVGILSSGAPVIVIAAEANVDRCAELLAAGACGYYAATSSPDTLLDAIEAVLEQRVWAPQEAILKAARRTAKESDSLDLTVTTVKVLEHLREGLDPDQIASKMGVEEVTVRARLGRLYRRFGVASHLQGLAAALRERT